MNNNVVAINDKQTQPQAQKVIRVLLDKPRNLALDVNAMELLEELTGKNVLKGEFRGETATELRALIYSCAKQEDDDLTIEQVGQYMYLHQLREVIEIMFRLMTNADPDPNTLAPFVPTPLEVLEVVLEAARFKPGDKFYDLGCGDGRIVVEAANRYLDIVGVGVEMNAERAKISREVAKARNVEERVTIIEGLIQDVNLADADVIFAYLLTESNKKLRPQIIRDLKPGARVVTHDFPMPGWKPYFEREIPPIVENGRPHWVFAYEYGKHI